MSDPSELVVERTDNVVTLTLNRPERRNGVTWPLIEELIKELEAVAGNAEDRAVVLTGAGGAFCSGMDLAKSVAPHEFEFMRRVGHAVTLLHELAKPTIAKVSGAAVGFGCNLALACDLVLAGETAQFGEIFADRGLSLDGAGSWSLPRLIGLAKAKEIVFFASKLSGAEAHDIGLVNRVVAEDKLDAVVAEWATRLADGPTLALSMMKKALNTSLETPFATAVEQESLAQSLSFRSREAREGMTAFLEKRPPRFRG